MNASILDRIKSLPPLPKTLVDMQLVCDKPDGTIAELAKVVEHDPMIVANLLKSANSPLFGFGKEIVSVKQAVSLFGMSMTRSIAISASVRKLLKVDIAPYNTTPDEFAEVSSNQAKLASAWMKKIDPSKKDIIFLAALMQEMGKIIIADVVIQEDEADTFASEISATHNIAEIEKSFVDETTATVTAAIFAHWGFDDDLVNMIHYSDTPMQAPDDIKQMSLVLHIVKTAVPINNPFADMSINLSLKKAKDAGFDHEILEDEIDHILDTK